MIVIGKGRRPRRLRVSVPAGLAMVVLTSLLVAAPGGAASAAGPSSGVGGASCGTGDQQANCSELLQFYGDRVQHNPKVYLIFWGSQWNNNPIVGDIVNAFNELGGSAYNNILTQYADATGPVNNDVQYMADAVDTSAVPTPVTETNMDAEALRIVSSKGWPTGDDDQFLIFPQQGSDPHAVFNVCGRHGTFSNNSTIEYVMYPTDENCVFNNSTVEDSLIATAIHEYAEAATDPSGPGGLHPPHNWGWSTPDPANDEIEVADKCQGYNSSQLYLLINENIYVQPLWDQANKQCSTGVGQDFSTTDTNYQHHTVVDPILTDYNNNLRNELGPAGEPADEQYAYAGGIKQDFATGAAYISPANKTSILYGAISTDYGDFYEPTAAHPIGWPAGNIGTVPSCSCGLQAQFDNGTMVAQSSAATSAAWLGATAYATWSDWEGPNGPLGWPTDNQTWPTDNTPTGTTWTANFQHGTITDTGGAVSVKVNGKFVTGHAAHALNDYPWETIGQFEHSNEGTDPWAEYYGQCDSFAAWKVYENLAGTPSLPPTVPDPGWVPTASPGISPVNQNTWGNADNWGNMAPKFGYVVDNVPTPGAIVWWKNAVTDPTNPSLVPDKTHGIGEFGHVGYVTDVYPDGSITIAQYNLRLNGQFSTLHMAFGQSAVDTSFNQGAFTVPWPDGFIHIGDGPASGQSSPSEPAVGTVSWGYASRGSNLQVIGPGSPSSEFSTGNVWYNRPAHGELGSELYTHTNGPTAVSTATWTPSGLAASSCYQVDAFVPDNYSDNPVTVYTVTDATGTSYAAVNENEQTNDWSELGIFKTNSTGSGLKVMVDDRGNTGLYVAADAMRFWRQPDCNGEGDVSPIMGPSSYYPSQSSWTKNPGHGFFGSMYYTGTTGTTTPSKNAMWTPSHLIENACYDISVYVPDNYSDNPAASYWSNDAYYGPFFEQVDENSYTNQFAGIGTFEANADRTLPLELFNSGSSNQFVAADAAAFVLNPNCQPQNKGTSVFGQPLSASIIGPGSSSSTFGTTGNWSYYLGFGWANHQLYSPDNAGATATWTFTGTPGTCYNVDAYIPILGFADNTNAGYLVSNNIAGGLATINQNTAGGWTNLSRIGAGSDGKITVKLTDVGSSGGYTAADEIRFTAASCP